MAPSDLMAGLSDLMAGISNKFISHNAADILRNAEYDVVIKILIYWGGLEGFERFARGCVEASEPGYGCKKRFDLPRLLFAFHPWKLQ